MYVLNVAPGVSLQGEHKCSGKTAVMKQIII